MNIIWICLICVSLIFCLLQCPNNAISIMTQSTTNSINLCVSLLGIYILWMGFIQIMQDSGIADKLAKLLSPFIRLLFGNIDNDSLRYIAINLSCNMLGLGNASTPAGLKAMQALNNKNEKINQPMAMLFCLNCCSLQLFPTTIISMRSNHGSINASDVIIPIILVSIICFTVCILLVKIFYRRQV